MAIIRWKERERMNDNSKMTFLIKVNHIRYANEANFSSLSSDQVPISYNFLSLSLIGGVLVPDMSNICVGISVVDFGWADALTRNY